MVAGSVIVNVVPSPRTARHCDIAPEKPREGPGDREAETRAAELAGGRLVGLGEALEQPAHLVFRHADPGIPDLEGQTARRVRRRAAAPIGRCGRSP